MRNLVRAGRTTFMALVFAYLAVSFVADESVLWMPRSSRAQLEWTTYFSAYWGLIWRIAAAGLVISILDVTCKSWEIIRGNQASEITFFSQVKSAHVVIANPVGAAVAIQFNTKTGVPRVVARGVDEVSRAIAVLARNYSVPVVVDNSLAGALNLVEADGAIPVELYRAVAQILANVAQAEAV